MSESNTNLSSAEIMQFKTLFSKFCRGEVNAGRCEADTCEWCPVNKAYDEIFDSLQIRHEATVAFSEQEIELYNRLLAVEPNDTDDTVKMSGYEEDSTIAVVTAHFDNGYFADIKLCSGQSNFFGDSILFNEFGREECVLDCFDDIHIGDVFEFETGNEHYVVTVTLK